MQGQNGRNYALTRGEVYFDRFAAGSTNTTGERYIGNTPEISSTIDSEELEHFDSDHGVNDKDDAVTLSQTMSGSMVTDNIVADNLALLFRGTKASYSQTSQTGATEDIVVKRGLTYQLGSSEASSGRVAGARHITNVVVTNGATPVTASGNYEVDLDTARVYIELDAAGIADDDELTFTYDIAAYTMTVVVGGTDEIEGALRYVGFNPKGEQLDYFWPRVKLSPNGDFALKSGEDWQTIPFNIEFLKKGNLEKVYITNRGVTA